MRARMTTLFGVFVAVLVLVGGAFMHHHEERRAEKRSYEIVKSGIERARVEMEEPVNRKKSLLQVAKDEGGEIGAGGLVLIVFDASGVLWKSHQPAPLWPAVGENWRVQTISRRGQTMVVAQDWKPIAKELNEAERALWLPGIIFLICTTLGAWFVVGKTLLPLDKLASQAKNASAERLKVRLEAPSSDAEMQHLTQTLNDLLGRLEKEAQARGRFYAAASHELRTPLQALLGQIEVAMSRPRAVNSHEEMLVRLHHQAERLVTLVQDLLELNALEMRQDQSPREKLNLAFWVQRAFDQQSEGIESRSLSVAVDMDDLEIEEPSSHVEILLRNLVENAVKYALPNSEIRVNAKREGDLLYLTIWNAFNLTPDTEMDNWFEPFFRHDTSRNSTTGGNGLGLSIVAALAHNNGWKVNLQPRDQGVEACVIFPKQ